MERMILGSGKEEGNGRGVVVWGFDEATGMAGKEAKDEKSSLQREWVVLTVLSE